jgi:hypothetical protein
MMKTTIVTLLLALLLLAGCAELLPQPTATPSPTPTAAVETPAAVATDTPQPTATLPATATVRPTATTRPTNTLEPPTPTAIRPTSTATFTPAPGTDPVTIDEPAADATADVETTLAVSGSAPSGTQSVSLSLEAAGVVIAEASAMPSANGQWEGALAIPANATGNLIVRATAGEQVAEQIISVQRPNIVPPFITLVHPDSSWNAVSGRALFFQGRVQRPPEGAITIALLYDGCQATAAEQSFDIGAGGRYWGFVVIPPEVTGPACAVAYFAEPGDEAWRAATALLQVVPPDDPDARGLFLGNFPDNDVPRGEPLTVYGSAYNAPNRQVQVSLEVGGAPVAQGTAIADAFGYWEIDLTLPESVPAGSAGQIVATVPYPGDPATMSVPFIAVTP